MCTDDVNILGGSVHAIEKNAEALVVASKETRLEVTADKSKYMVMYPEQNAGRSQNKQTDNNSFESVEEFKYLGTTVTNQNSIQEEIKRIGFKECLLSFGAESFIFHFAIQ